MIRSAPTTVTLPTGERLMLGADGVINPLGDGLRTGMTGFNDGKGDRYLIPSEALPYAGHQLDMALFDLTKLAALNGSAASQGSDTDGRIPVQLTFQSGVVPAAPPGVTLTATSGSTATGYVTAASGTALAAALRHQLAADRAAGKAAGASGLPGGLASMTLAGGGTGIPVTPHYPMRILQINAIDGDGLPANAPILLVNTDNSQIYQMPVTVVDGIGRVAVPAGNYAAFGAFYSVDAQGMDTKDSLVPLQDFQVPASGDVPAQTLDARSATAQVTVATDQPSTENMHLNLALRQPVRGTAALVFQVDRPEVPTLVAPAPKAVVGQSAFQTRWSASGPATGPQYQYNLTFTSDHEDADLSHRVSDSDLARDVDTAAGEPWYAGLHRTLSGGMPAPFDSGFGLLLGGPLVTGVPMTGYYTPGKWIRVLNGPTQVVDGQYHQGPTLFTDPIVFAEGDSRTRLWGQGPVTPGARRHTVDDAETACEACAGGGGLNINLPTAGDSNLDTSGRDYDARVAQSYYWNGQPISSPSSVPPWFGLLLPSAPAGPGTLRAVLDIDRTMGGATQSTKTHTDVSFPYSGQADPAAVLPAGNECVAAEAAGQPTAPCQILPVLTINYRLAGLSLSNASKLPVQPLALDIGHAAFGSSGPQIPVTSAQVSISTDGGASWKDVPTNGALGHYVALWQNPAAGTSLTLRVTAEDAVGGTITQTVTDPYTVG